MLHTQQHTLSLTSQLEMLPLCSPTRGLNAVITHFVTSIPTLVDYFSLLAFFKLYLSTKTIHMGAHNK